MKVSIDSKVAMVCSFFTKTREQGYLHKAMVSGLYLTDEDFEIVISKVMKALSREPWILQQIKDAYYHATSKKIDYKKDK